MVARTDCGAGLQWRWLEWGLQLFPVIVEMLPLVYPAGMGVDLGVLKFKNLNSFTLNTHEHNPDSKYRLVLHLCMYWTFLIECELFSNMNLIVKKSILSSCIVFWSKWYYKTYRDFRIEEKTMIFKFIYDSIGQLNAVVCNFIKSVT